MPSHTVSEGISFRQMEVNYSFHKRNDEALKEKKKHHHHCEVWERVQCRHLI